MRTRTIPALAAAAALALTACGGDSGGGALSEDDFVDAVGEICDDISSDLQRIDFPADDDYGDFSKESLDVLDQGLEDLRGINPPDDLADGYDDFIGVLEDERDVLEQLGDANGSDEVEEQFGRLAELSDEQSEIAQDLDVAECDPNDGAAAETTVADTTPATTAAPTTTAPPTTAAPITLPTTVPPAVTTPVATTPVTEAPAGTSYEIVDLTTQFVAPDGFYLVPKTPDQGTIDLIATLPELNEKLLQLGVATLVSSESDLEIADVWLGLSITDSMPADWKTLDCPTGDLRTSGNGILGIVCTAALDSPFWEIFTATDGDVGISVYTRVPDITGDLVADAFLEANF